MRLILPSVLFLTACAGIGPGALQRTRVSYNETVKVTSEQEMLLNIVRLRYGDTPSSLAITNIAAQYEFAGGLGGTPFFAVGGPTAPFSTFLPNANLGGADRPTLSMTPLDDGEFARRLFTPLSLEGVVYLAKTTWPIQTVFRLYLENLNWVPNAQTASGPTPALAPPPSAFNEGMAALQTLQQRGDIVFGAEAETETLGPKVTTISTSDLLNAAEQGIDVTSQPDGRWQLTREKRHFHMRVNPSALDSAEMQTVRRVFHLKRSEHFEVTVEAGEPFGMNTKDGEDSLDVEPRSMLQALYFVSHGVNVPAEHLARGLARTTRSADGKPFDWAPMMAGLFNVKSAPDCGSEAHVSVEYGGACFFIDATDHDTRATFALLMELSRLQLSENQGARAPLLTIPVGR
ncbi:MAG: hypothetical protein QM817_19150 [Archangium sp.]